eukprot:580144_1
MSLFVRIAPHVYVPRMQNEDDASTPIASCTSIKEPPTTRIDPLHPPGPPPSDGYRLFPTNLVNHSRSFDTHYSLYRKRKFARPINVYTYNCLYYFVNMGNRASVTNRPQIGPDAMNPIATPHIPTSIDRDQEPKSTEHHKQSPMTIVNGIYQWFIIIFLLYLQVTLCRCSSIVMGSYHTCLVSANKRMKCFGRNDDGMLGYGDTNNRGDGPGEMGDSLPDIDLGSDFAVMQIAPASFYTCALSVDSRMKCFGRNWYGVLGQNDLDYRGDEPGEMGDNLPDIYLAAGPGDFKPTQIVSGSFHNCALSDDHMVKCFGDNSYGQQGNGDTMLRGGYAGSMESLIFVDLGTDFQAIRIGSAGDSTLHPSHGPTNNPSVYPIITPTSDPLYDPTNGYTTAYPTSNPSYDPTVQPSEHPSDSTRIPSQIPSYSPTEGPLTEWSIDTTDDDAGYSEPVVSDNDSTYIIIIVCLCCIMCIYLTYKGVKKVLVKRKASIDEGNIDQNVHAQQPGAAHARNNRYEYPADALHAIQYSDDQEQKEGQREREKEGHNSQPTTGERTHGGGDVLSALETTQGGITQG